ncbi:NUDIX domain-containing protein [Planctomycetota bacterium]|nr:NUDIX domain-containing protein [Planctomycetota bacterium]
MTHEAKFLSNAIQAKQVRVSVRGICIDHGEILLQKPVDDPNACYAFIGGQLEYGEVMRDRLAIEFCEEFGLKVIEAEYGFVVENRFMVHGEVFHGLEHYYFVKISSRDFIQREKHIAAHWIAIDYLEQLDVRPLPVKSAIVEGKLHTIKHIEVPLI